MGRYYNCTPGPLPIELDNQKSCCPRGFSAFVVGDDLDGSPELQRMISIGKVKRLDEVAPEVPLGQVVAQVPAKVVESGSPEPLTDEKKTSDEAPVGARHVRKRR
jgi:hypothetical protein